MGCNVQTRGQRPPLRLGNGRGDRLEQPQRATPGAVTDAAMDPRRWPGPVKGRRRQQLQTSAHQVEILKEEVLLPVSRGHPGAMQEERLRGRGGQATRRGQARWGAQVRRSIRILLLPRSSKQIPAVESLSADEIRHP